MDGCGGLAGGVVLILLVVGLLALGGMAVVNWADVQIHKIENEMMQAEARAEQARAEREREETKQLVVEGVTDRMAAVNRLPLVPLYAFLGILLPCLAFFLMYLSGLRNPEWFATHLPPWML